MSLLAPRFWIRPRLLRGCTRAGASRYAAGVSGRDEIVRTLSADGSVAVRALSARELVREAVRRHRTSPTASVALGRALMGGLLMASEARRGERLQIQVRGDGPLGAIVVTVDDAGSVRGYVQRPAANPPLLGEHLGVADAVGSGLLRVDRSHPSRRPYSGIVRLETGEIAQDLAHYLLESEQKPSAVALGVYLSPDGEVEAAGGYLVQALPGAPDASLADFERRVEETRRPSALLHEGASADAIVDQLLGEAGGGPRQRLAPRFHCPCDRERVRGAVLLLGRDELRDAAARGEELEVRCAFCADVYRLPPEEVASLVLHA
jgi:molecular chaperone Hsp33